MIGKFDIMTNGGDTFYGTIRAEIETRWKITEGGIREVYSQESISKAVYKRFPTLRGKPFEVIPYSENRALFI